MANIIRRAGGAIRRGASKAKGGLSRVGAKARIAARGVKERHGETILGEGIGVTAVTVIVGIDEATGLPPGISAAGVAALTGLGAAASKGKARTLMAPAVNMAAGIAIYFLEKHALQFAKKRMSSTKGDF